MTAVSGDRAPISVLADAWPVAMVTGILTGALGIAVMAWPEQTLTVVSVLLGIQLLIFGLFRLVSSFSGSVESPVLLGLVGVLGMVVGVVVLRHPFESISILATLLGVVWIVGGVIDLFQVFVDSHLPDRGVAALAALFTIGAGIVVVAWPDPTITVIAWISGLYLLVIGLIICFGAFSLRRVQDDVSARMG